MIKAVLLDIDDTLLDFGKCAEFSMKSAAEEIGIEYSGKLSETFHRINNSLWAEIEKGRLTHEELYGKRWCLIFSELGIDADGRAFEGRFRHFLSESAVPVDGACGLLEYLSPQYTLCAASNGPHAQQLKRLESAGMLKYIQHVFTSEKIGFSKPSREFFDVCFSELGNPDRGEVMIIGDSLAADISGGIEYGMKTCWYNHRKEDAAECGADYVVTMLDAVKKVL